MYSDVNWLQKQNEDVCRRNAIRVASSAEDFEPGRWLLLGLGDEDKWYGSLIEKPLEKWNSAKMMMQALAKSGHPVWRCSSPLSRGVLKSKGGGRSSIHYNADLSSAEMLLNTIVSVNPHSNDVVHWKARGTPRRSERESRLCAESGDEPCEARNF